MTQLAMAGDDWLSDNDRKRTTRAIAARKKAALAAAKKLEAATDAVNAYLHACNECNDGSGGERGGAWDGRRLLMRDMTEFAGWLTAVYDKEDRT